MAACIHEVIDDQIRRTPGRIAVVARVCRLSYAELGRRADDIARSLVERGTRKGALVGICVERDDWLVPAMLGVWKAGAAYVPLDPAYPIERLRFIAADAGLSTVLTCAALAGVAAASGAEPLVVQRVRGDALAPEVPGDGADPAYIIYIHRVPPGGPRAWWSSTATP